MKSHFTEKEIEFLTKNYPTKGAQICADQLKRSKSSVSNKAHHLDLKIKDRSGWTLHYRRKENNEYKVNGNLFMNPTTPEAVYVLGFLWADGHIGLRKTIRLKIQSRDGRILKPILGRTGDWRYAEYPAAEKTWQDTSLFYTCNRPLCEFLEDRDYKSKNKSPCEILKDIPSNLKPYWWRGYFDGDGCFYQSKDMYQVAFSGPFDQNWAFAKKLFNHLKIKFKVKQVKTKRGHSYSHIRVCGRKQCFKFLEYIYNTKLKDDDIFLPRKRDRFLEKFPNFEIPRKPIKDS
jgi:hypothetical protein